MTKQEVSDKIHQVNLRVREIICTGAVDHDHAEALDEETRGLLRERRHLESALLYATEEEVDLFLNDSIDGRA